MDRDKLILMLLAIIFILLSFVLLVPVSSGSNKDIVIGRVVIPLNVYNRSISPTCQEEVVGRFIYKQC